LTARWSSSITLLPPSVRAMQTRFPSVRASKPEESVCQLVPYTCWLHRHLLVTTPSERALRGLAWTRCNHQSYFTNNAEDLVGIAPPLRLPVQEHWRWWWCFPPWPANQLGPSLVSWNKPSHRECSLLCWWGEERRHVSRQ
jgi:hypothetical protein